MSTTIKPYSKLYVAGFSDATLRFHGLGAVVSACCFLVVFLPTSGSNTSQQNNRTAYTLLTSTVGLPPQKSDLVGLADSQVFLAAERGWFKNHFV